MFSPATRNAWAKETLRGGRRRIPNGRSWFISIFRVSTVLKNLLLCAKHLVLHTKRAPNGRRSCYSWCDGETMPCGEMRCTKCCCARVSRYNNWSWEFWAQCEDVLEHRWMLTYTQDLQNIKRWAIFCAVSLSAQFWLQTNVSSEGITKYFAKESSLWLRWRVSSWLPSLCNTRFRNKN